MRRIITFIATFILILVICVFIMYINIFPLAKPIELPKADDVYAVKIEKEGIIIEYIGDEEISDICKILSKAKPTRIITAHDRPMVREYLTLNFSTEEDRLYTSFIYIDNSKWYIEQAYMGVYEIRKGLIDFTPYIETLIK